MQEITKDKYIEALNKVAGSEEGRIVLAALKVSCQWDTTYVASDDPVATHFHSARRGVYGSLRKDVRPEDLKAIEFDYSWAAPTKGERTKKVSKKR